MAKLQWDQTGQRLFETGTDRGVIYPYDDTQAAYGQGIAWNGLTGVTESPDGAEETALYADNIKYVSLLSAETFGGSISAYTYPEEFALLDGSAPLVEGVAGVMIGQQARGTFAMAYRTLVGNDVKKNAYGYKIHLVYGMTVSPSEKEYASVNDSPEAVEFSWDFVTTPIEIAANVTSATIVIDSTKVPADQLAQLETILYGNASTEPHMPTPEELMGIFVPETVNVPVESITADPASLTVAVGSTADISAIVSPANATNKNVSWASGDEETATVAGNGTSDAIVTGVAAGEVTITGTSADGNHTAEVAVTVTAN
jgi:hypothetical protein